MVVGMDTSNQVRRISHLTRYPHTLATYLSEPAAMSNNGSNKSSNSQSESSGSSPNQPYFHLDGKESVSDGTLCGSPGSTLNRTGTVRRVSSASKKDVEVKETAEEIENTTNSKIERTSPDGTIADKFRKSIDSTYRHSLESIHEYKTQNSFSTTSLIPTRDSSSSECADYAEKSYAEINREDKTLMSQSSSYLSWIESVNSEYFGTSSVANAEFQDCDNKVGEWNNFWLNYNSARSKYLSTPYLSVSQDDKTADDFSEVKSNCSTQKDITDRNSTESVSLTIEEVNEAVRCSQRVTEILQNALRRSDHDFEDSNNSYYSQSFTRQSSSIKDADVSTIVARERSYSYAVDAQDLQKQKLLLKNTPQSSSTSCINALMNTGVADMLKRVIAKRRDSTTPSEEHSVSRGNFPDWTSAK